MDNAFILSPVTFTLHLQYCEDFIQGSTTTGQAKSTVLYPQQSMNTVNTGAHSCFVVEGRGAKTPRITQAKPMCRPAVFARQLRVSNDTNNYYLLPVHTLNIVVR